MVTGVEASVKDFAKRVAGMHLSHTLDTGEQPPPIVSDDDVHILARPIQKATKYITRCSFFVVLLDANLELLKHVNAEMRAAMRACPTVVVCDWLPCGVGAAALVEHVNAVLFGAGKHWAELPASCVQSVGVESVCYEYPVSNAYESQVKRMALTSPLDALRIARCAASYTVAPEVFFQSSSHVICVCESKMMVDLACRMKSRSAHASTIHVVYKAATLGEDFVFPNLNAATPWTVVFAVAFLNAYEEQVVLHRLGGAGVHISRAFSVCYSADKDTARSETWTAFKDTTSVVMALHTMRYV